MYVRLASNGRFSSGASGLFFLQVQGSLFPYNPLSIRSSGQNTFVPLIEDGLVGDTGHVRVVCAAVRAIGDIRQNAPDRHITARHIYSRRMMHTNGRELLVLVSNCDTRLLTSYGIVTGIRRCVVPPTSSDHHKLGNNNRAQVADYVARTILDVQIPSGNF